MGLVKEGFGTILLIIAAVLIAILYFLPQLEKVSIEKFDLSEIKDISLDSFTLDGNIFLKNPSTLSVPIKSIDYQFILEETGEIIGTGETSSFFLEKEKTTPVYFEQKINWIPAGQAALETITKDSVYMLVKGNIYIDLPKVKEYAIPFEKKVDIKPYTDQFLSNYVSEEVQKQAKGIISS
jgi:LEA14-like dessication related protein